MPDPLHNYRDDDETYIAAEEQARLDAEGG
jgi:hypothetical protein